MKNKIRELIKKKKGIRLELGGGNNPQKGFINMDMRKLPTVDIVHNIEDSRGFPIPTNTVTQLLASHLLEHICPKNLMFVMSEIHRVCKHEAQVIISVPYAGSHGSFMDPTHCNFFTESTFQYFDDAYPLWTIYKPPIFKIQMSDFTINGNLEVILSVHKTLTKKTSAKNTPSKKTSEVKNDKK